MLVFMARPLHIEFSGALFHVTSRGDRREAIFDDDIDLENFLDVLAEVVDRYRWICHAYCLMTNHYHLVIEIREENLSKGMRQLNGVFTQTSNRRHQRVGHLFQGRFKAILVDKDEYLLELSRYVVLNPVRAGMVDDPADWPWSSYRDMLGMRKVPDWLTTDQLLGFFGTNRQVARTHYQGFVLAGIGKKIWDDLRHQVFLGNKGFVERMLARADIQGDLRTIPATQRRQPSPSLTELDKLYKDRNTTIIKAYATGAYSYSEIADYFGIHQSTVGRIVRKMLQCET
jgi:REP element-mobilizing transposase RayT